MRKDHRQLLFESFQLLVFTLQKRRVFDHFLICLIRFKLHDLFNFLKNWQGKNNGKKGPTKTITKTI